MVAGGDDQDSRVDGTGLHSVGRRRPAIRLRPARPALPLPRLPRLPRLPSVRTPRRPVLMLVEDDEQGESLATPLTSSPAAEAHAGSETWPDDEAAAYWKTLGPRGVGSIVGSLVAIAVIAIAIVLWPASSSDDATASSLNAPPAAPTLQFAVVPAGPRRTPSISVVSVRAADLGVPVVDVNSLPTAARPTRRAAPSIAKP